MNHRSRFISVGCCRVQGILLSALVFVYMVHTKIPSRLFLPCNEGLFPRGAYMKRREASCLPEFTLPFRALISVITMQRVRAPHRRPLYLLSFRMVMLLRTHSHCQCPGLTATQREDQTSLVYSALELRSKSKEAIDTPGSYGKMSVFLMQAGFARASRCSVSLQPPAIYYTFPVAPNSRGLHCVSRGEFKKGSRQ